MKQKEMTKKKRNRIIVISSVLLLIAVFVISGFILLHSYIKKMNIQTSSDVSGNKVQEALVSEGVDGDAEATGAENADELESASEDTDPTLPDSSEADIAAMEEKIRTNMEEDSTSIVYDKDVFNVLLIGCDSRKSGGTGRSDTMILVSINKNTKNIIVTSLLRDIYLQIPGKSNNRLNAAYAFGGADLLLSTIKQNFKLEVNRYASIDFYAFIEVVDAVGGVTIDVTEKEIPVINKYVMEINQLTGQEKEEDCLTETGDQLLNGKQVLGYVRNRYVGNSDFERTARQRRVLKLVYDKVKKLNLIEMKDLLDTVLPQVTTNLSEGEIFTLILSLPAYMNYDMEQWSIPMANSYQSLRVRKMAVLGIDFEENINELRKKIYRDAFSS